MQTEAAKRDDIPELATLWAHAFPGERTVAERMRQLAEGGAYGDLEDIRLLREGGRVVAACRLYRMRQHLGGALLPMMGLAAVAVAPQWRRRGAGRELCAAALREARDRGDVLSVLYPFRPSYYRALGWAMVGELHRYRFRPESLLAEEAAPLRLAENDDVAGIAACYASHAAASHGPIERGPAAWKHHLGQPRTTAFVLERDGAVRGYLLARYGRGAARERRVLEIRELVASSPTYTDRMLGWVRAQRDLWRLVQYDAAPDEHFAHRLAEPRPPGFRPARELWDPVARVIRGPMLRVLDVEAALRARRCWGDAGAASFTVELLDRELPENEGPWEVRLGGAGSGAEVGRTEGGRGGPARGAGTRLSTDATGFAAILGGELGVAVAVRLGLAEAAGDVAALDRAFRAPAAFRLYDEF
jgi:predicted acetyltransferase